MDVDIDLYKIVKKGKKEIKLEPEGELTSISADAGGYKPNFNTELSKIIKDLNEAFGTNFTDDDKIFLGRVKDNLLSNVELMNKMENNSKENVKAVFDKYFNQEMNKLLNGSINFYKRIVDNEKLRKRLKTDIFDLLYLEYNKIKREKETSKT